MSDKFGPLQGITVVDFSQMMAGPFATQILSDLGARIIKVEKPSLGEWERSLPSMGKFFKGQSPFFLSMNRGKDSLAIDLKSQRGKDVVNKLLKNADVVTSNFRPGTLDRLGFGYEEVRKINPEIIYSSSSGFGSFGPWQGRPGQDLLLQAVSGMLHQSGKGGEAPSPVASSVIDAITSLYNVIGILASLTGRAKGKTLGAVEVSMLEAAIAVQCQELAASINLEQKFERSSSGLGTPWNDAPYAVYKASDGYFVIAMADLSSIADLLDIPDLKIIANSGDTFALRDKSKSLIDSAVRNRNRDDIVEILLGEDIWCAPVLSFEEVRELEQVKESGILRTLEHPEYGEFITPGLPIRFSNYEPDYKKAPPVVGEQTREILESVGISDDEIRSLEDDGVISTYQRGVER